MQIRLAYPLQTDSIVDGEGIRTVIWTQGCIHNCLGCHNPSTHSFNEGFLVEIDEIKEQLRNLKLQDGITLSGGDPFLQVDAVLEIAKFAKSINLNVWCYTGYTFEQLLVLSEKNNKVKELLNNIDILIDGKFMLEFKSLDLLYRGSSNQRIIDVKRSLEQNKVIVKEYQKEAYYVPYQKEQYMYI